MNFVIISKDWKETWADYVDVLKRTKDMGYKYSQEHGGDEFGIDADFIVLSDSKEVYKCSRELVLGGFFEVDEEPFNDEEEIECEVLESYEKDEEGNYILKLKDGTQRKMVIAPWE